MALFISRVNFISGMTSMPSSMPSGTGSSTTTEPKSSLGIKQEPPFNADAYFATGPKIQSQPKERYFMRFLYCRLLPI